VRKTKLKDINYENTRIFNLTIRVGMMKAYELDAEVKFEYSNSLFHTAQLFVNDFDIKNNNLIMKLAIAKTDCKAKEECGVPEAVVAGSASDESCCSPESGCC